MEDDNIVVPVTFEVNKVVGTFDYDKVLLPKRLKRKNMSSEEFNRDTAAYQLHTEWVRGANLISKINTLQLQKILVDSKKDASYIAARSVDRHLTEARTAGTVARTKNTQARAELQNAINHMMEIMSTPEYQAEKDAERQYRLSASELAKERLQEKIKYEQIKDENHERKINREEALAKNKYIYQHNHDLIRKALAELRVTLLSTKIGGELQKIAMKREAEKERQAGVKDNIKLRDELWRERQEIAHQNRLELIDKRAALRSPLSKLFGGFGLTMRDFKNVRDYNNKNFPLMNWDSTVRKFKNIIITGLTTGITALAKKTLSTLMKTSKAIVGVFINAAKQAETFKTAMNLALAPLVTMFTLLFVPLVIAMVPLIKTMFDWVINNKDAIMAVGEKLAQVFDTVNLNIVAKVFDSILYVMDALAGVFANNASMIDTSSVQNFISSTVVAVTNMIQDVLMGIVAFCYSPEGQAFIKSVSYAVGKVIGTILTTLVALIPVIFESIGYALLGVAEGIRSTIVKAIFNFIDMFSWLLQGALQWIDGLVNIINSAINALNSINIFGFSPNMPLINNGSPSLVGSSISNFRDQGIVNNYNINNSLSMSNSTAIREILGTGVY